MGDQMRYAISVRIIGVMHKKASKIKMFMTSVLWSDESEVIVYRSLLDFKEFHRQLKKRFPLENPFRKRDRVIPKFRAIAMRRKIQKKDPSWSMRRMNLLENYCSELLRCDPVVSCSSEVTQFFMPKDHDLQADFTKNSVMILPSGDGLEDMSGQRLSLGNVTHPFVSQSYCCVGPYNTKDTKNRPFKVALDERLDVLIKDPAGWWLVENEDKQLAWFPAPYLEMCEAEKDGDELDVIPLGGTLYCAVRSYSTKKHDEVPVPIGSVVEVLRKSDDGWWLIRYKGRTGYSPSMYLQPYNNPRAGLHNLQRKLHSSSLNLATHMDSSTLNLASSRDSQSGNCYPPTLYEETGLQQHTSTQTRDDPYRASCLQKTRSLELLSETRPDMAVPPSQREREDLESNPDPAIRKSSISWTKSSNSDISSSGRNVRTSSSSCSEEEPQSPPNSPRSSPKLRESNNGCSIPEKSLSSSPISRYETGSCKMPTTAPRVPPRPRAQEILTRCTTMTRKAALASRGRLFSLQDPVQTH